jgi:RNAse (barnase) inhibitor barstar|tara:strand:- start:292 stop:441 length:150 start_codon:yes stop_codon:yes gene_type:complete
MDKDLLKRKIENPVRALAKELEGRGQMEGIIAELVRVLLANVKELNGEK